MEQKDNSLKNDWKDVGKSFGALGKNLGKSIVHTAKKAVNGATKWARDDEKNKNSEDNKAKGEEPVEEKAPEEPDLEESKE